MLPGEKTRSRPIFSPTKDTFGLLCIINNYILLELARILPSFCYRETDQTLHEKMSKCTATHSVDLDASSNDACQWKDLKNTIDT